MTHKICFKAATKEISVLPLASEVPVGFTNIGNYIHDAGGDPLGTKDNHVIWHHIRDALYHVGVQDMAYINISFTREIESVPVIIYPLDASEAEVIAVISNIGLNIDEKCPMLADQSPRATITAEWETAIAYGALQAASTANDIDFSVGKKAFGLRFILPEITDGPLSEEITIDCYLYDRITEGGLFYLGANYQEAFGWQEAVGNTSIANNDVMTFVYDAVNNLAECFVHGVSVGTATMTPASAGYLIFRIDGRKIDAVNIGKTIGIDLITDLSELGTLPEGTTDIYGNAL